MIALVALAVVACSKETQTRTPVHGRLEIEVPAQGTTMVRCDPMQLQQVITNLATNARDAMPEGGTLTIRPVACEHDRICIDVADTGAGIPADALPRIFEPLFTTKASGTGIGLSVVQQVITRAGGSITVDSVVGSGTVFHIELLRAEPSGRRGDTAWRMKSSLSWTTTAFFSTVSARS
jgi:signal transduction histidine kinase